MTDTVSTLPASMGTGMTHLDALPPGTRLAEFELQGLLGVGGFGMVYQAYDHSLQREVAIKEYLPASLARRPSGLAVSVRSMADQQTFADGLESFVTEARLLAQFDHPSLVKVYRFWRENNTAYMAMPLYRGTTLKQARAMMRMPPPEDWLRKVLWSVLGALKMLHTGDTMHRDISPENILLLDNGPPVLLDLGAARRAISAKNQQLTATLKFSYAPIEQYGETADLRQGPWTDLYALASVVYSLISPDLPLPATLRTVRDRMPSFASVAKAAQAQYGLTYSSEFVSTIDQSLAIRPSGRPKSVNGFARSMDLRVPTGMSKFDWRADLGPIYAPPPPDQVAPDVANDRTVQIYALGDASAQAVDRSIEYFSNSRRKKRTQAQASRPWPLWVGSGLAVLLIVVFLVRIVHRLNAPTPVAAASASTDAPAEIASAPAAPPVATGPSPVASAEATPEVPGSAPQPSASPAPAGSTVAAPTVAVPGSALVVRAAQAKGSAGKGPVAKPGQSSEDSRRPQDPPAGGAVATPPHAATRALPNPVAAAPAPAAPQATPESLCADRNFLARPMCIYQECQKPEFVSLPQCVDNAKHIKELRGQTSR